jgi:hypothetical protein
MGGGGMQGRHKLGAFSESPCVLWYERALGGLAVPAADASGTDLVVGACRALMQVLRVRIWEDPFRGCGGYHIKSSGVLHHTYALHLTC